MKLVVIFFAIALLISCNSMIDPAIRPFTKIIVDSTAFQQLEQKRNILDYANLENGVDSFEIRLWTSLGHTDLNIVQILKFEDGNWHQSQSRFWYSGDSSYPNFGSHIFLDSSQTLGTKLTTPLKEIIESLYQIDFITFPSQREIQGFTDNVADGTFYNLEIATTNFYKHFSFHEPEQFSDSVNQKFMRIVNLLATKPPDHTIQ